MDTGSIANQPREEKDPQIDGSIMYIYIYNYIYIFHISPSFLFFNHYHTGVREWTDGQRIRPAPIWIGTGADLSLWRWDDQCWCRDLREVAIFAQSTCSSNLWDRQCLWIFHHAPWRWCNVELHVAMMRTWWTWWTWLFDWLCRAQSPAVFSNIRWFTVQITSTSFAIFMVSDVSSCLLSYGCIPV